MASLTLTDIKTIAKGLVNEKSDQFWNSTEQTTLANIANRTVYKMLVDVNPEMMYSSTSFSWPAMTDNIDMTGSSYLNAEPQIILGIQNTPVNAPSTIMNLPSKWVQIPFQERYRYQRGYPGYGYFYTVQGNQLYCTPTPRIALNVTVFWIPQCPALSGASDAVLGGYAESFGDAVAYCLAHLLNAKQNAVNPAVENLWEQAKQDIKELARTRTADEPRKVVYHGLRSFRNGW